MAEAEAAGHVRSPDHVEVEELIDCRERIRFADPGGLGGQLGLEALAGDGGTPGQLSVDRR
jgi:hypothetical protein